MLAEALRLIRVYHDLKQQDLADHLDISKSYISEIESGKKTPSIDVINKYSEFFSIPASSILFFAENIDNPSRATRTKAAIAGKVLRFLQLVESKTEDDEDEIPPSR